MKRVAITGIGIVSGLGATRETTWDGMLAGRCGIRPVTAFDAAGYRSQVAAEVPFDRVQASRDAARAAAAVAVGPDRAAGRRRGGCRRRVARRDLDRARVGVLLGAGTADLIRNEEYFFTVLERGIGRARPSSAWNHFSSTTGDVIAGRFGFEGLRTCVVAACSSSTIAIGQAADAIRVGRLDAAIAGGADALSRLTYSGFNALRLMDRRSVPTVRSVAERHEHRRRRGTPDPRGHGARAAGAARRSTASSPGTDSPARRSIRRRRSPMAGRWPPSCAWRSPMPRPMPARWTTSTRTARRRRRTIGPKRKGFARFSVTASWTSR